MVALLSPRLHSSIYSCELTPQDTYPAVNRRALYSSSSGYSHTHNVRASSRNLGISATAFGKRCENGLGSARTTSSSSTITASSSKMTAGARAQGQPGGHDLLVVGPGVLGSLVGKLWLESYPGAIVIGQTNTTTSHDQLRSLGLQPRTKDQADGTRYPYVLFAAPPSGSEDYAAEIAAAAKLWDGTGSLLFTGSAGIFATDDGSMVNEDSTIVAPGISERNDRLIYGEAAALEAGGSVVRLVGLYHALRGAHTFFLRMGEVSRWGGYIINLIHYEDAAALCVAILRGDGSEGAQYRSRVFLGTDGAPVTLQEMMDAVHSSGAYEGHGTLSGEPGSKGKLACNAATREALGWSPRWNSFEEFMASGAQDWFRANADAAVPGAGHP